MLLFWKQKLVYLATPKTGTTAIESALDASADMVFRDPPGIKHTHLFRFEKYLRPFLDRIERREWEVVSVVREPVDWLGSWYRYRRREALEGSPNSTRDISFDDFVEAYLADTPPPFAQVGSQSWFFRPFKRDPSTTQLFAYDELSDMVAYLEQRLNRRIAPEERNRSPSMTLELSRQRRRELETKAAADFELYEAVKNAGQARRVLAGLL